MQSGEEDIGLIQCDNCYKHFYANRNIAIDYSTKKAKYGTCGHCGKETVVENFHSSLGSYEGLCPDCGYKEERRFAADIAKELSKNKEEVREEKSCQD